jgi:hypothetical protein
MQTAMDSTLEGVLIIEKDNNSDILVTWYEPGSSNFIFFQLPIHIFGDFSLVCWNSSISR